MKTLRINHTELQKESPMLSLSFPQERQVEAGNLSSLLTLYLAETQRKVSPSTYKVYIFALSPLQQWWEEYPNNHHYILSRHTMAEFLTWYQEVYQPPASESTTDCMLNKTTTTIRRFFRWMHQSGVISENIVELCPLIEYTTQQDKYYPSVDDLARMFAACKGLSRLRDAALLAFLVETAARRFEAAEVKREDLFFDRPDFAIDQANTGYVHLRVTKGNKGGKKSGRYSVFSHITTLLLKQYILVHEVEGSLFDMNDAAIWYVVRQIADRAGLPSMHPHAFRSLFIDWYSEQQAGGGMMADLALKLQIGHTVSHDVTTAHYIDLKNREKVVRRIRSFYTSPLLHLEQIGQWKWDKWLPAFPANSI